jgi:hypothetical protein
MRRPARLAVVAPLVLAGACQPSEEGLVALGSGEHTLEGARLTEVATAADGLASPRDLGFHPEADELWIVNHDEDATTILFDPDGNDQRSITTDGLEARHFLARPSAIAFGGNGFLATAHEEDRRTQGMNGTPADFMGPTLWIADSQEFEGGWASHYDMLHNSPNGVGIAHEPPFNTYWVVDGYHGSLTRYDFGLDHGPGGHDHSDGVIERYAEGEIPYLEGVSSHAEYADGLLYVADAGGGRVIAVDPSTATQGNDLAPNYDGGEQYAMNGATVTVLANDLDTPSGLAIRDGVLYVADHGTSTLYGYDLDGNLLDWLETGLPAGSVQGIDLDPDGRLHLVDTVGNRALRIDPK